MFFDEYETEFIVEINRLLFKIFNMADLQYTSHHSNILTPTLRNLRDKYYTVLDRIFASDGEADFDLAKESHYFGYEYYRAIVMPRNKDLLREDLHLLSLRYRELEATLIDLKHDVLTYPYFENREDVSTNIHGFLMRQDRRYGTLCSGIITNFVVARQ